jgi:hypothetical protein
MRFLYCTLCFLVFPPFLVPLLALDLPCRLVVMADIIDALAGMDDISSLLC